MAPCEELQEEVARSGPALIVGATGYIGRFVAEACLDSGRRTFILVRPGNACPARAASVDALLRKGAFVVEGRVDGKDGKRSVETALRAHGIEVVISVMGGANILDQLQPHQGHQAASTVKVRTRGFCRRSSGTTWTGRGRWGPGWGSEEKRRVRRAAEAAGVPTPTSAATPSPAGPTSTTCTRPRCARRSTASRSTATAPSEAFFVAGTDIGKFTVKAAYDARSVNKAVHFSLQPPQHQRDGLPVGEQDRPHAAARHA
ncbi:hypothetical protein ZWY2020_008069 [Hordeum vulgare]|nr:hypothetical protein ZWY2020_008069 [Hordeum vulgare]